MRNRHLLEHADFSQQSSRSGKIGDVREKDEGTTPLMDGKRCVQRDSMGIENPKLLFSKPPGSPVVSHPCLMKSHSRNGTRFHSTSAGFYRTGRE